MDTINFLAIFWGVLTAVGLSLLAGLALGFVTIWEIQVKEKRDPDSLGEQEWENLMFANPVTVLGLVIVSLLIAALSGYVAARFAPQAPYLHAGIVGAIGLGLGVVSEWRRPTLPVWAFFLSAVGTIPFSLLGGWIFAQG